jgi:hypothetical protein
MKLTMTDGGDKYGAPPGLYRAKFLGARADTHPDYGPGLKWEFEIVDGPSAGRVVSRTTQSSPTLKNGCGKMLQMLTGGVASLNQELDLDVYVGRVYEVMVEINSTGNGTRVGSVKPTNGQKPAPTAAPPPAAGPRPTAPPPPRPQAPPAPPPAAAASYWVQTPQMAKPEQMTEAQLQSHIDATRSQAEVDAIGVMPLDQSRGWGKPGEYGLKPSLPY